MLLRCPSKLIVPLRHDADVLNAASPAERRRESCPECMRLTQQMLVAASRTFLAEIRTPEFVACIARTPADLIELDRRVVQTPVELARPDELVGWYCPG
jgi:hypothetical protein